jgi:hypothetical protein
MIRRDNNNKHINRNQNETRGYYQNLYEKYTKAAKGNRLAGDVVMAEYNLQYAEHYMRLINEKFSVQPQQQQYVSKETTTQVATNVPQAAIEDSATLPPPPQKSEDVVAPPVEKKPARHRIKSVVHKEEQDNT